MKLKNNKIQWSKIRSFLFSALVDLHVYGGLFLIAYGATQLAGIGAGCIALGLGLIAIWVWSTRAK